MPKEYAGDAWPALLDEIGDAIEALPACHVWENDTPAEEEDVEAWRNWLSDNVARVATRALHNKAVREALKARFTVPTFRPEGIHRNPDVLLAMCWFAFGTYGVSEAVTRKKARELGERLSVEFRTEPARTVEAIHDMLAWLHRFVCDRAQGVLLAEQAGERGEDLEAAREILVAACDRVTLAANKSGTGKGKITKEEANVRAREILKANPSITARDLSTAIPCGLGLVSQLPAWQAVLEERRKRKPPKTPKVVSLEAIHESINQDDEELNRLTKEQHDDGKSDGSIEPFEKRGKSKFVPRRKL